MLDEKNNLIAEYEYDSWGRIISIKDQNGEEITDSTHIANANPFRYRGYYYDEETGLYYLNSRYYSPILERFLSPDNVLTKDSILGYNFYSYAFNNPINKIDIDGNKPGDLFATMDEAARDFGLYINEQSINVNREYGSYIYKTSKTVLKFRKQKMGFLNVYVPYFEIQYYYSYSKPKKGTIDGVRIPTPIFKNQVATIHTHAAYDPKYDNDNFSDYIDNGVRKGDIPNSINRGIPTYVVTPLGTLRRYDPADGSDIIIFDDLPYDSNHPKRK